MATLNDEVYLRAARELQAARAKVQDLETFVRVYAELVGGVAFAMPTPAPEPPTPVEVRTTSRTVPARPAVSLNDPELTITDAAAKVLREMQRPMRARELAELMMEWGFPYPHTLPELRASVGGVLSREVREGNVFAKARKGVFALREWGEVAAPQDDTDDDDDAQDESEMRDQHPAFSLDDNPFGPRVAGEVLM